MNPPAPWVGAVAVDLCAEPACRGHPCSVTDQHHGLRQILPATRILSEVAGYLDSVTAMVGRGKAAGPTRSDSPLEQRARVLIDRQLTGAGWVVQDGRGLNLYAGQGVAVWLTGRRSG